jgi:hypothetical protein
MSAPSGNPLNTFATTVANTAARSSVTGEFDWQNTSFVPTDNPPTNGDVLWTMPTDDPVGFVSTTDPTVIHTGGTVREMPADPSASSSDLTGASGGDSTNQNSGSGNTGSTPYVPAVAVDTQDLALANEIYQTVLGRAMSASETQNLTQYISGGALEPIQLASDLIGTTSAQYQNSFVLPPTLGFNETTVLENALGRMPTPEEAGTFEQIYASTGNLAAEVVAIAQYALGQAPGTTSTGPSPPDTTFGSAPSGPVANDVGGSAINSQLQQFVNGMATFGADSSGFNAAPAVQIPADATQNVIAAGSPH